ncbi:MAG: arginine--tRNA ligase [Planctomycetota bacterium]
MNGWVLRGLRADLRRPRDPLRPRLLRERDLPPRQGDRRAGARAGRLHAARRRRGRDRPHRRQARPQGRAARSDGTSVYITQDLGTTVMKAEEFDADEQIWVVGDEQIYHFKVLFEILSRLGYPWADKLHHLAYGMVHAAGGEMKSARARSSTPTTSSSKIEELARREIAERDAAREEDEAELAERARKIGLAALKFMILGVSPQTTMTYDPKASVSFEGDTGPYVLYAYARIRRMLEDAGDEGAAFDPTPLGDASERRLALRLIEFPGVVARAARELSPGPIATWLIETARAYHSHNRQVPILKAEDPATRRARLDLSRATAAALRRGLELMGIETVDRM